jgi:uncharacterized membrane protein
MTWLQRYRVSSYFKKSFWILPAIGMVVAVVVVQILHGIEKAKDWELQFDPSAAQAFLGIMAGSMFTLIIFVCSALLITLQLASVQLTPRIIGLVLHKRMTQVSLTLFVFTFTFTLAALARIKGSVPLLTGEIAVYSCLVSLCFFLYLIENVCSMLRPSGALILASQIGLETIYNVYPRSLSERQDIMEPAEVLAGESRCTIANLREGVVLAFDMEGLVSIAQHADCVIELVPQVGDFVAAGQPLFRIFGDRTVPEETALYQSIAVGPERTLWQDPAFAFRIMVDIASKGLSPAINDPTTAVLAIDQIQHLLRHLANLQLNMGQQKDKMGSIRLIYRTPGWEDFVSLAITEIRQFGGTSIQVNRRLRAMLEDLIQTLPEERTRVLKLELDLLVRGATRFFMEVEDRAMANVSDFQGMGGKQSLKERRTELG